MTKEELRVLLKILNDARWRALGLYNIVNAGNTPGTTNGPTAMCAKIMSHIDEAIMIVQEESQINTRG